MNVNQLPAIVTGAASGLGAATAVALSKAGAKVTLLDVAEEAVVAQAQMIGGLGLVCDVSSAESVERAINEAKEKHGAARILVNCAATPLGGLVAGPGGPMDLSVFEQVIAVNLTGTFNTVRVVAADMLAEEVLEDESRGSLLM